MDKWRKKYQQHPLLQYSISLFVVVLGMNSLFGRLDVGSIFTTFAIIGLFWLAGVMTLRFSWRLWIQFMVFACLFFVQLTVSEYFANAIVDGSSILIYGCTTIFAAGILTFISYLLKVRKRAGSIE